MTNSNSPTNEPGSLSAAVERPCQSCDSGQILANKGFCCRDFRSTLGSFATGVTIITALALVSSGFGACITPESASRLSLPNVLYRKIDIEPQPTVELACLYRRGDDNPVLHNFLDVIRHYKHQDI